MRFLILAITFGFVYDQVFYHHDFSLIIQDFHDRMNNKAFLIALLVVLLMMLLNWGVEAMKWKYLIRKIEHISLLTSFKATLTGVAVSSFTPNRIGDYLGRVFILEKGNRIQGVLITIIGSVSQFLITFILGSLGIAFFVFQCKVPISEYLGISLRLFDFLYAGLGIVTVSLYVLSILLFLNVSLITGLIRKIVKKPRGKAAKYLETFTFYTPRELINVLLFSALRFFFFSLQFYILLRVFNVPVPLWNGLIIIAMIFFVVTVVPTVAITELGIRGSIAVFLLNTYFEQEYMSLSGIAPGAFAASSSLWLINLAIPALMGAIFVFNLKFFRKK